MRRHHLNCISTCPLGGRLMDGRSPGLWRGELACHCVLLETDAGLVLLDTGLGLRDVLDPRGRLSRFFLGLVAPDFRVEMTARRQVEALGFRHTDVRHIVLTHLDFDHAGGLDDFPHARVHLLAPERDHAALQATWLDRQRFRPQQWSTQGNWVTYGAADGGGWLGFDCVRELEGLPPEILLVPLFGHTLGHAGIAVRDGEDWLLLAGDAYFHHGEMELARPHCTPGLRAYQWMMDKDHASRRANQQRLRGLLSEHRGHVRVFCSHDPVEFERIAGRALGALGAPAAAPWQVAAGAASAAPSPPRDADPPASPARPQVAPEPHLGAWLPPPGSRANGHDRNARH